MTEDAHNLPVMEVVKTAWAKVSGAKGSLWAIFGIFIVIQMVLGGLGNMAFKGLFSFLGLLVQLVSYGCLAYVGIRRAQDAPISYKMMFDVLQGRTIACLIGFWFLQVLIIAPFNLMVWAGFVISTWADQPSIVHMLGVLMCIIFTILLIYVSMRLWLCVAAVVDKKLNPWEAVKYSFHATKGNVFNLFIIAIIYLLLVLLCAITFGIALIWVLPLFVIIYGEAYRRLSM